MNDHLFSWLDARLNDHGVQSNSTADDLTDETELLESLNRVEKCASLLDRVWPAADEPENGSSATNEASIGLKEGRCGRFEIRAVLGRGGMANVFLAHDPAIGRDVALKVPHPGLLLDPQARERFAREARATGILRHPNIVRVLESGEEGPVCFIAFEYCNGPTLSQWLADRTERLPVKAALRICIDLAEAVQHAHDRGVVHRDLKPGNVLMDEQTFSGDSSTDNGNVRTSSAQRCELPTPRITDFGLARLTTSDSTLTRTGAALGTAEYMAPEQTYGAGEGVVPASDQFSLGVILYQLLTGTSPFRRENVARTLAAVQQGDPVAPSRVNADVPRDLDAICLKALQKKPTARYATVGHFADDLQRCLEGVPTEARPISRLEFAGRWLLRHPALAASTAVCFVSLLMVGIVGWVSATKVKHALERTQDLLYAADVRLAGQALNNANARHAVELLGRHNPNDADIDRRTFAWHYLWGLLHQEEAILPMPAGRPAFAAAYTPDERFLVSADETGRLHVWETQTNRLVKTLAGHSESVRRIQFTSAGDRFLSIDDDGQIAVWDLDASDPRQRLRDDADGIACGCFDSQTDRVFTGAENGLLKVWTLASGDTPHVVGRHRDVRDVACSLNGQWFVSVGKESSIKLWNQDTGELVADEFVHSQFSQYRGPEMRLDVVAFAPDSKRFAVGSNTGHIFVWDVDSGTELAHFGDHTSNIYDLAFSPDGRELASASKDTSVRLWNLESGKLEGIIQGHGRPVYGVCYSPAGRQLATCGKDGTVRVWNRAAQSSYTEQNVTSLRTFSGCLSTSRRELAGSNWGGQTHLHVLGGSTRYLPTKHAIGLPEHAYSPDGRHLAVGGDCFIGIDARSSARQSSPIVLADLDGDGDEDAVSAFGSWGQLMWQENDGSAALRPPRLCCEETDFRKLAARQIVYWDEHSPPSELRCRPDHNTLEISPPSFGMLDRGKQGYSLLRDLSRPTCVWPADVDQDGDQDLIIANYGDDGLFWFENDESRPFQQRHLIAAAAGKAYGVVGGDINADGLEDVIVLTTDDAALWVIKRQQDGSFAAPETIATGLPVPAVMDVCDLNEDGLPDVLCASHDGVYVSENVAGSLTGPLRPLAAFDPVWVRPPSSNVLVWDLEEKRIVTHFHALAESVYTVAFSSDSATLVTSDEDRNVLRLWSASDGTLLHQLPPIEDTDGIRDVEFSHDGRALVFVAGDNGYIWGLDENRLRHRLVGHDNTIERISLSPDGRLAATVSHDYSVRVWDIATGKEVYVLVGHEQQPRRSCFAPDGKTLATAGDRGEVVLWDLTTGQQLLSFTDFRGIRMLDIGFQDPQTLVAIGDFFESQDCNGTRIGTWRAGGDRK